MSVDLGLNGNLPSAQRFHLMSLQPAAGLESGDEAFEAAGKHHSDGVLEVALQFLSVSFSFFSLLSSLYFCSWGSRVKS